MKQIINIFFSFLVTALLFPLLVTAQSYKLPAYQKFTLKNGLTIYLMEHHDVPTISLSAILPAGAINDGQKAGLAYLTANALTYGTKSYTKARLDETLDLLGATISSNSSKEFSSLSANFASKDKETILNIVSELLTSPVFDEAEFAKDKKRILLSLEQAKERPRNVIGNYFDQVIFGHHPYSNIAGGTTKSVNKIDISDLKQFYRVNYMPNGSAISVVGDFRSNEMKALITKVFSGWKKGIQSSVNLTAAKVSNPSDSRVLLINKNDAKETTFMIGAPGISKNNPDEVAIIVINTLFGGRFTSMLNDELRVNSGLTYGAGSLFTPYKNGGSFAISTFTATPTTEQAIDKVIEVIDRLHKNGIDQKSLTSAKNYVKGSLPTKYETSRQLANLLTKMFYYDFDESYINNFEKNVDGLTLAKAKQIIEQYFPKDKLQFVLIGKSADILKIAQKYGTVKEVQITDEPIIN